MQNILRNWNFMRILRLGLGIFVVVEGFLQFNMVSIVFGSVIALSGIFNVGCCGSGGCGVDYSAKSVNNKNLEPVTYEEVADKK